ncbi:DMT family transporter [Algiphilus sp. W345]|uniref:DMT family transporter n=1 Tax=Banduia mediterranea TaxID=3075609 RepID=A0ABU2WF80_9GAMM|nr:DMT family transporter [Algiphilus sp. W345]MDT0496180.1 DMT family transporter [Algiphilus sp. W345]
MNTFATGTVLESDYRAGVVLAGVGAVLLSGKVVLVKLLYQYGIDAIDVLALRMLTALPLFGAVVLWTWRTPPRPTRADLLRIGGLGFLGYYVASMLDLIGLQYVSAGLERMILFLTPSFVLLIGIVFQGRRVCGRQWLSLAMAYGGIALVVLHDLHLFGGSRTIALGSALIALSAVLYATYLVLSEDLMLRLGAMRFVAQTMCVSSLLGLLQYPILRPVAFLAELPAAVWWLALANGLICTALPVFLTMIAVRRIGAGAAAQAGMIGPASTLMLAAAVLGEAITPIQVLGTALVTGGVLTLGSIRRLPPIEPRP